MSDLMKVGADWGGNGAFKAFTAGVSGAQRITDAHARYLDAIMAGRCYYMSVAAATPTAYVGAAAGTPLLAIHNPSNNTKYANLLAVGITGRVAGSVAGQTGLNIWSGPSATPTGTLTTPRNKLTGLTAGSSMLGFSNTALTGSSALNLSNALWTYYWATAAGAIQSPGFFDAAGLELVVPGNEIAIGLTTVITSATYDLVMIWEELPYVVLAA